MYYVCVDPVGGSDSPSGARRNASLAAAQANPWASLETAEAQERTNLTTLGDSLTIVCGAGTDDISAAIAIDSANWPGMTSAYRLIIEGESSHDGSEAAGTGYTVRRTGATRVFMQVNGDTRLLLRNIRVVAEAHQAVETGGYDELTIERCVVVGAWQALEAQGGDADGRRIRAYNSLFISTDTDSQALIAPAYNSNALYFEHCGFIGNHATLPAVSVADAQSFKWCYAHNRLAGGAYGGAGWSGSVKSHNAASDATAYDTAHSVVDAWVSGNNIAFSTSAGGYFANVTAGSVDLAIGSTSALRNAATDSTETMDILGASRPQGLYRDVGVYELDAAVLGITVHAGVSSTIGANSGSFAVTIPDGCNFIWIAMAAGITPNIDAEFFTKCNFDDSARTDFTRIVRQKYAGDDWTVEAWRLDSSSPNWPGTGAKTFYYTVRGTSFSGIPIYVGFMSGVNTSSPIVATGQGVVGNTSTGTEIISLTGVGADDVSVVCVAGGGLVDATPSGSGQISLLAGLSHNLQYLSTGYKYGSTSMSATGPVIDTEAVAFAVKAAANDIVPWIEVAGVQRRTRAA